MQHSMKPKIHYKQIGIVDGVAARKGSENAQVEELLLATIKKNEKFLFYQLV